MSELIAVKTTPAKLFAAIERLEKHRFVNNEFYEQKNHIAIQDENLRYVNIKKLVIKEKPVRKMRFSNGEELIVSENHLIATNKNNLGAGCAPSKNINAGAIITCANGSTVEVLSNESLNETQKVYDFEIDSTTHLYSTVNGIVHHNSEKGKSLITDVFLGRNIEQGGISMKVDIEDSAGYEFTSQIIGSEEVAGKIQVVSPSTIGSKATTVVEDDEDEEESKGKKGGKGKKVISVETLTQIINKVLDFQDSKAAKKNKSVLMVVDSITQLTSDKEFKDISANKDKRDMTSAQKIRGLFRAVTQRLRSANTTIIGIAHLTANIGVMFGPKFVVNAKGTGFAYASSLTLLMKDSKEIVDAKTETPVGLKLRIQTHKNRCALKGRSAWMKFYFAKGIDKYGGLCDLLAQYGVFKPSKQPVGKYSFEYDSATKFTYVTNSGIKLIFKDKDFAKVVEENGGDEFLRELNDRLNEIYTQVMENTDATPEEIVVADDDDSEGEGDESYGDDDGDNDSSEADEEGDS